VFFTIHHGSESYQCGSGLALRNQNNSRRFREVRNVKPVAAPVVTAVWVETAAVAGTADAQG